MRDEVKGIKEMEQKKRTKTKRAETRRERDRAGGGWYHSRDPRETVRIEIDRSEIKTRQPGVELEGRGEES